MKPFADTIDGRLAGEAVVRPLPVVEVLPLSKAVGDFGIVKRNGPPELLQGGALNPFDLAGEARNVSLLLASAVNAEGCREILGICEGAKE